VLNHIQPAILYQGRQLCGNILVANASLRALSVPFWNPTRIIGNIENSMDQGNFRQAFSRFSFFGRRECIGVEAGFFFLYACWLSSGTA
jgi:hypothetical protein